DRGAVLPVRDAAREEHGMSEAALPHRAGAAIARPATILAVLAAAVLLASAWSIGVGAVRVPLEVIVNTLFDLDGEKQTYIIMRSRLPRTLVALLAGGSLALSGAIIQGVIRNPLASPNVIGINSGAALFALGLVLFFPQ